LGPFFFTLSAFANQWNWWITIIFDALWGEVEQDVYSLELFHGPTLAFKDFGALFLFQVEWSMLICQDKGRVVGGNFWRHRSAVANGFWGVDGVPR